MEVVGQIVSHIKFGLGTITWFGGKKENDNKYIIVKFDNTSMELSFPAAFEKYLKALDPDFAEMVNCELSKLHSIKSIENKSYSDTTISLSHKQKHKPLSYCAVDTFIFKKETGYNKSKGKRGFLTYDKSGNNVGVTFMHDDKRREAYGQAEICFYDKYISKFGEWRLIFINKERLSFNKLSKILERQDVFEATIDPRKGS